jgi:conjugative transfer signal peptidase TraF
MTRAGCVVITFCMTLLVGASALLHPAPKLIWNASGSVPIGLYTVHPAGDFHVGELVVARPPAALATFLDKRGYLAMGVPLVKHILALPGQTVCRTGRTTLVDGHAVGDALDRDHRGRTLPIWQGCRVIANSEVFLMNRQSGDSLDGRYFGPLPATTIVGRADPLWTDKDE